MASLLVIDDDAASCRFVRAVFKAEGIEVIAAHDADTGHQMVATKKPDLVLLDLHLGGANGIDVLARLKQTVPAMPVIMLTAQNDVRTAVRAAHLGAADYLTKPVNDEEMILAVRRALTTLQLEREVRELRQKLADGADLAVQMGPSAAVRRIIEQVQSVASSSLSVLLLGETGAGKEVVAQAIHRQSERGRMPFVAVDCGAIPEPLLESELFGYERGAFTGAERRKEGQFQLAEGGTFFLDELGNLPLSLQGKLLRVLESKRVQAVGGHQARSLDVRILAATNEDLQRRVAAGQFRADLYFRLAQYTIALPSLRERPSDIGFLAQRFLDEASIELRRPVQSIEPEAVALLEAHAWPGNVRELRNVVRQAVLHCDDVILRSDIIRSQLRGSDGRAVAHAAPLAGRSLRNIALDAAEAAERGAILETLRATGGNKSQAAKALQTDYKTLHVKLKKLGIRARDFGA